MIREVRSHMFKYCCYYSQIPHLIWVLYLILIKGLYYSTSDDLLIADIIRGAFTGGSWDAIYSSPILSLTLYGLYWILPRVSWMGILFVFLQISSMFLIDSIILSRVDSISEILFFNIIMFICWYQTFWNFTFTTVAYSSIMAGIFLYFAVDEYPGVFLPILSAAFLFTGVMVRREAALSIIIILVPLMLYKAVMKREIFYASVLAVVAAVFLYIFMVHQIFLIHSPVESEYTKINSSSMEVSDHMDKEDVLNTKVWNSDEVECYFESLLYDKDVYCKTNFDKIADLGSKGFLEKIITTIYRFIYILNELRHPLRYENIYIMVLLFIAVVSSVSKENYIVEVLCILIGFTTTVLIFAYINRYMYRSTLPGGIFAILLILWFSTKQQSRRKTNKKIPEILIGLTIMILMLSSHRTYYNDKSSQFDEANNVAMDYFADHQDTLFLAAQSEVYGLSSCVPVLRVPQYKIANFTGDWNTYSESYYSLVSHYGVKDPDHLAKEAINSNKIRFLAQTEKGIPTQVLHFLERYCDNGIISAELEDTFYTPWMGEWGVYAITSD